jgi:hypothetical protein
MARWVMSRLEEAATGGKTVVLLGQDESDMRCAYSSRKGY